MSAAVETIYFYGASCADCLDAFGPDESEAAAEEWAANHDAENHNEDDRTDTDYDHYKESLREPAMTTTGSHAAPWSMKRIVRMLSGAPSPRRRPPTVDVLTAREAVARHLFSEHVQASKLDMLDYDNSVRLQTVWGFEADRRIEHAKSSDRHVAAFHHIADADWIHLPSLAQKDYREAFYQAKGL